VNVLWAICDPVALSAAATARGVMVGLVAMGTLVGCRCVGAVGGSDAGGLSVCEGRSAKEGLSVNEGLSGRVVGREAGGRGGAAAAGVVVGRVVVLGDSIWCDGVAMSAGGGEGALCWSS